MSNIKVGSQCRIEISNRRSQRRWHVAADVSIAADLVSVDVKLTFPSTGRGRRRPNNSFSTHSRPHDFPVLAHGGIGGFYYWRYRRLVRALISRMTSSKCVLQQRHLLGYESEPDPWTLTLTLTLFLTVTRTKFLKENKTGQKWHQNIGQHRVIFPG